MSKRILVVEDQPDNRQIIRDMLAGTDYEIPRTPPRLRPAIRHGFPTQAAKDEPKPSIDAQGVASVLRFRRSSRLGTWVCTLVVRYRLDPLNTIFGPPVLPTLRRARRWALIGA